MRVVGWVVLALLVGNSAASARLVRVEIASRSEILDGRSWSVIAGAYEKVVGKAYFAVDPTVEANRVIADIDLAPRNADGWVEFSSDFYLLRPIDPKRGNGAVLCEINNRGNKGMLAMFNGAGSSRDPTAEEHFGDGFLMRHGFTLLWVGWQFDPPAEPDRMLLYPPVARAADGSPIRGLVRSDFVKTDRESDHSLADRDHAPYPVADLDAPENVLTVRDSVEGERRPIPREKWRFARATPDGPVEDRGRVWLEGGFEPGKIYEVVYVAEDPPLVGLGPAAVRDFVSYLKRPREGVGLESPPHDRALGFGISQSGRFLRTFLYYGFNRDEDDRRAFDGVFAHVAGGGRGSFNHRFAQPSRDAHPYLNFFYPTDIFPFTDEVQRDPVSGREDGLLARYAEHPEWLPKIFYTNSSYEYWGRAASLIHSSVDGKRDVEPPSNVRIYLLAGTQHGPGSFPPSRGIGQQLSNAVDYRPILRALLPALDNWVRRDVEAAPRRRMIAGDITPDQTRKGIQYLHPEPPPSRYPRIADGTLVAPERLDWPKIPSVGFSTRVHKAYRADYGPRFYSEGIVDLEPPKIGSAFPILVPQVGADGNELAGVRLPDLTVPLATNTGWNLFNANSGPTDEISSMQGSYIPFPRTAAERAEKSDPRRSIAERYEGREDYLKQARREAEKLVEAGYLLEADAEPLVEGAARRWDSFVGEAAAPQTQ